MMKVAGYSLIIIGVLLTFFVANKRTKFFISSKADNPHLLLTTSWANYKKDFIYPDGRIIDPARGDVTISEGQSYAMLQAVWMDDQPTFDLVWRWTKNNLKRPQDHLLAWRWGKKSDSSYGILDTNSASDAESDIALALILADRRWHQEKYREEAQLLLADMWTMETAEANGHRYLIGGNWAQTERELIINPSYFAPYAWRIFATYDTQHDWSSLVTPAYDLLTQTGQQKLDAPSAVGLPPDWVTMNKKTGTLTATDQLSMTTNYAYDAMRVPWRISLDYMWNKDERARTYLLQAFRPLAEAYQSQHSLAGTYDHEAKPVITTENPVMYATALGYFMVADKEMAADIYQTKILRLYTNSGGFFNSDLLYYDQNWLWFGTALYNHEIVNYE